jgi:hypothetical protein
MPSSSRSLIAAYTSDSVPATSATTPGVIHSATVIPKASSVFFSARDNGPMAARSLAT